MPPIYERIEETLMIQERTLWAALTSASPSGELERLSHPDCVYMFPKKDLIPVEGLEEAFKDPFHKFDEYDLSDVRPVVIDLMAGTITYRIRARRDDNHYVATGSSTWGQGSDGEWRLVHHQETLQ